MAIKQSIWVVGEKPVPLEASSLADEQLLETMIEADPSILAEEWMLIGRQVQTSFGGRVDLLAIAPDSSLVLIELKRHRTPREVVAQAIDYASWVETLAADAIREIYAEYTSGNDLSIDFEKRFHSVLQEEFLNESHQIVIVAAELDPSTERIIDYLATRNIPINAIFFEVFKSEKQQFLSRRWFADPATTQLNKDSSVGNREPWNGYFYVSFGDGQTRSWEDARHYGFISAGGGAWYSRTLNLLQPLDRVWVRIPGIGYVGYGIVDEVATPREDFKIVKDGISIPISALVSKATYGKDQDVEDQEYFVRIKWVKTFSISEAYNELGFFGNQNSVCRPTAEKWNHTVERLKLKFMID